MKIHRLNLSFRVGTVLLVGAFTLAAAVRHPGADLINGEQRRQSEQDQRARPNIIFVLTDDLDRNLGTLEQLPGLKDMLAGQGVTFPNMFVTESLCCPSRSS